MLPVYKPFIGKLRVLPKAAVSKLQDCFEKTDWSLFDENNFVKGLEQYTSSVLSYINFCTENVTIVKQT